MRKNTLVRILIVLVVLMKSKIVPAEFAEHACMCDASAAVAIGSNLFIVANDEDNILRIYENKASGDPIESIDLTSFLKPDPKKPEADIEGATRVGDIVYWITSHGANKNGKYRDSRHRFFATEIKEVDGKITVSPIGIPYAGLIDALNNDPKLNEIPWKKIAEQAPKDKGALNIEGLCGTPSGAILIAFRNPIPNKQALIIPLENPEEVITGGDPKFGEAVHLALGELGIRSIEFSQAKNKYLIVAGPYSGKAESKLYAWSGNPTEDPQHLDTVDFIDINPEALIIYQEEEETLLILSDDGTRKVGDLECKDESVPKEKKKFRSTWVKP